MSGGRILEKEKADIQWVPLSMLKPAPYNPRKDLKKSDPEYKRLKESIEKHGFAEAFVWNKRTGHVISGHQRKNVLIDLGWKEGPCFVFDKTLEEEMEMNIKMNSIGDKEEQWDINKLNDLLGNFDDLTIFGLSESTEKLLDGLIDDPAKPNKKKTRVQPGQTWMLGDMTIICLKKKRIGDVKKKSEVVYILTDPKLCDDMISVWEEDTGKKAVRQFKR